MLIYSLRSEMPGIVVEGFESDLSFPTLLFLFCSSVYFPSIFRLEGVEAGFVPEKVVDVIC